MAAAKKELEKALELAPYFTAVHVRLGDIYLGELQWNKALDQCEFVLRYGKERTAHVLVNQRPENASL